MVMDFICVAMAPLESATFTLKTVVPVAAGIPVMYPVLAFRASPAGSTPASMLQVYMLSPPYATSWSE